MSDPWSHPRSPIERAFERLGDLWDNRLAAYWSRITLWPKRWR